VSGTAVSALVLAALAVAGLLLEAVARRGSRPATAGETLCAAMRTASGRIVVLAVWLWLGVHFLAR
jgi:hypothetical protein